MPSTDPLERLAIIAESWWQTHKPWQGEGLDAPVAAWRGLPHGLMAVAELNAPPLTQLLDPHGHSAVLLSNLRTFAKGKSANHALLWGARGMGKSSLVRAVCHAVMEEWPDGFGVIEILQEGLPSLSLLLAAFQSQPARRFVLLLDDLAFEDGASPQGYNALKSLLEGSLLVRPGQILLLATSNRRHLVSELALEQDSTRALHAKEAVEEKVSLSDRFGLWLGFPSCSQEEYLAMVGLHAAGRPYTESEALEWAMMRGGRSGRVAAQFVQGLAAKRL